MAPHKAILRYDCSSSSASLGGDVTNANLFEHYLNVLFMNLRAATGRCIPCCCLLHSPGHIIDNKGGWYLPLIIIHDRSISQLVAQLCRPVPTVTAISSGSMQEAFVSSPKSLHNNVAISAGGAQQ